MITLNMGYIDYLAEELHDYVQDIVVVDNKQNLVDEDTLRELLSGVFYTSRVLLENPNCQERFVKFTATSYNKIAEEIATVISKTAIRYKHAWKDLVEEFFETQQHLSPTDLAHARMAREIIRNQTDLRFQYDLKYPRLIRNPTSAAGAF